MKKLIIFSFLLATIIGCKKNDGFLPEDVVVDRVPQPSVVPNGGSAAIDVLNLAQFEGKFDVKLLYPSDIPPAKLDVVIRKNNNNANIKLIQADVTTFPSSFTINAAQIATLFGATIALGDNYDIGVDIYTINGKKFEAFPAVGAAYGSTGVANQPGFSPTTRYSAICAYDANIYQGNFVVVKDDFAELFPGDVLTLTKVSETSFSFLYIHPELSDPLPVIVSVNTGNNIVSIAKQKVGSVFYGYSGPNFAATGVLNNFVAPCDQTVTLNITYTVDAGSFGTAVLVLKKQ